MPPEAFAVSPSALAAVSGMPRFSMLTPADEFQAPVGFLPERGAVSWAVAS